jgi:hypothetical protein
MVVVILLEQDEFRSPLFRDYTLFHQKRLGQEKYNRQEFCLGDCKIDSVVIESTNGLMVQLQLLRFRN